MTLVVLVKTVLDGVVLQIGNESRDVDNGHVRRRAYRTPGAAQSRRTALRRGPRRTQPADRRTRGSCPRNTGTPRPHPRLAVDPRTPRLRRGAGRTPR